MLFTTRSSVFIIEFEQVIISCAFSTYIFNKRQLKNLVSMKGMP